MLYLPSVIRDYDTYQEYMKTFEDTYEWNRNYVKERFKYEFLSYMATEITPTSEIRMYDRSYNDKDKILKYSYNKKELLDEIVKENPEVFEQEFYKKYL